MWRIISRASLLLAGAALMLWVAQAAFAQASNSSEQVVFSTSGGSGTFNGKPTGFGFWIWCEGESKNPYEGSCNGAMYFYALGITKHVAGMVTETASDTFEMDVVSTKDSSVACTLTNVPPITNGQTNTVNVSCTAPKGTGSAMSVVNVTGAP